MESQKFEREVLGEEAVNNDKNSQKSLNNENAATSVNAGIATGLTEISGRYGEATKEFLVALDGVIMLRARLCIEALRI